MLPAGPQVGCSSVGRTKRSRHALVVASVLLALAAAPMLALPGRSAPTVGLVAKEFQFTPNDLTAKTGEMVFVVSNQGLIEHNLVVDVAGGNKIAQIAIIEPGETKMIKTSLPAGTYRIYCGLPGHKEAGMVATLRVNP